MWQLWVKTARSHSSAATTSNSAATTSNSAASPTLKDLQSLLRDDQPPSSPSLRRILHRALLASSALRALRAPLPRSGGSDGATVLILYFTSLRVVRRTFEDCRTVRSILRGLRVAVDERDLAMDSRFQCELQAALGRRQFSLPQLFLGGRCLGGADEIRRLHESGELKALIDGDDAAAASACAGCGGLGYVLCAACSGSQKRYSDKRGGFRICGECNENGLVRCPDCCAATP